MKKLTGIAVTGLVAWAVAALNYNEPGAVYQFYAACLLIVAILFLHAFRPLKL